MNYSPVSRLHYVKLMPEESEVGTLGQMPPLHANAAWNLLWLAKPDYDLLLQGKVWQTLDILTEGLVPAIIRDVFDDETQLRVQANRHPLDFADFLCRYTLRCRLTEYVPLDFLWKRAIESADYRLKQSPCVIHKDGKLVFQPVAVPR